jgi:hypothetical protein
MKWRPPSLLYRRSSLRRADGWRPPSGSVRLHEAYLGRRTSKSTCYIFFSGGESTSAPRHFRRLVPLSPWPRLSASPPLMMACAPAASETGEAPRVEPSVAATAALDPRARESTFDAVVVGGGSAGISFAIRAASAHGARIALVDSVEPTPFWENSWSPFLGTCAACGCVPKKLLHGLAATKDCMADGAVAWDASGAVVRPWEGIHCAIRDHVRAVAWSTSVELEEAGVETFVARARLSPKRHPSASTYEVLLSPPASASSPAARRPNASPRAPPAHLKASHVVVATGTRPSYAGFDDFSALVTTSDDFFVSGKPPGSALILGGGYIAVELSGILCSLGYPGARHFWSRPRTRARRLLEGIRTLQDDNFSRKTHAGKSAKAHSPRGQKCENVDRLPVRPDEVDLVVHAPPNSSDRRPGPIRRRNLRRHLELLGCPSAPSRSSLALV